MDVQEFESKYKPKGGLTKLTELRSMHFSNKYIAHHFGVSDNRVRSWMRYFFKDEYNHIQSLRDEVINNMMQFAHNHSKTEFDFAFKHTKYYKEALQRCYNEKIYDIER